MSFGDCVNLVHAIAWPTVVLALAVIYRSEIPRLLQVLSARISRLSAVGITLELVAAEPVAETLRVKLDEIREPSSTGTPPPSGVQSLIEIAKSSAPADYVVIDLRSGNAWLTSRLYLFALVLPPVIGLRCLVFVGNCGQIPRNFLGLASPGQVAVALERRYPWLRTAWVETQLQPLVSGQAPQRYLSWTPYGDSLEALKRLIPGTVPGPWDLQSADALNEIVRSFVRPIDLSQPGQVETFVTSFLANPALRRPPSVQEQAPDGDWVHFPSVEEHAHWIKEERQLLDLLGSDLSRQKVVLDQSVDDEALGKAVLSLRGNFVAVTDADGRFDHLVDRTALLERVAAQARLGSGQKKQS